MKSTARHSDQDFQEKRVLQDYTLPYFRANGHNTYLHTSSSILSTSSCRMTRVSAFRSAFFLSNNHAQSIDSHLIGSLGTELVQDSQIRCVFISRFSPFEMRRSSSGMVVSDFTQQESHIPEPTVWVSDERFGPKGLLTSWCYVTADKAL
jgi:hypothetical protein